MRALVTGGAGFIGGHIAEELAADGHDVTVIDNFVPYYDLGIKERTVDLCQQTADENDGSYELVKQSITDEETVTDLVADTNVVYHQAAQAGVRKSVEEPAKVNQYNVDGTMNVLEAARKHDVSRVVVASSSSVYGKPDYLPYDEDHPTTPVSPYGVSKLATEQYARVYHEIYGLPTVSLRYFTVYGPRMRPNMAMTNFVSRCLRERSERMLVRACSDGVSTANHQSSTAPATRRGISPTSRTSGESTSNSSLTKARMAKSATSARRTTSTSRRSPKSSATRSTRHSTSSTTTPGRATPNTPTPTFRRRTNCSDTSRPSTSARASGSSSTGTARTRTGTIRWFGNSEESIEDRCRQSAGEPRHPSDRHLLRARNAVGPTTSMMRTLEYTDMSESGMDIETIAKLGGYENEDAVIDEAVRELLRQRPALRISVAVEKYRSQDVSLNRAAELASIPPEQFKDELAERGIGRKGGFLDPSEREKLLQDE